MHSRQNQHRLLRVCSVYAEDSEDKKDLFQDVLINIWQSMPSFEGRSALSTWMFRVTLNVCLRMRSNRQRKKDRFRRLDSIAIENIGEEDVNSEPQEQLARLHHCIRQLNDAEKAIITLYLEELSYKEIGEVTGLTENHVAVKIKRIKGKLLTCINESI